MKTLMRNPPVTVIFAEDDEFITMFVEDYLPLMPNRVPVAAAPMPTAVANPPSRQNSEVIELLDDD